MPVLASFPVMLCVASVLGFLAGIGVGGGSLLILWLTLVLGIDPPQARMLNLLFFIPCALIGSLFRWKQGKLPLKKLLPVIIAGCTAAAVTSLLYHHIDTGFLRKLYGILLLVVGTRELFYKAKGSGR